MDFTKTFLNARSLNAATRELSLEQLESTLGKLQKIIDERRELLRVVEQQEAEENAKYQGIDELLKEEGIDLVEYAKRIMGESVKSVNPPKPAKYEYMVGDQRKTWSGYGRVPAVIKAAIASGEKSMDDFLIVKN